MAEDRFDDIGGRQPGRRGGSTIRADAALQGDAARLEKAKAAVQRMLDGDNPADFTAAGFPDLRRLRVLADFDVSAEERDAAWKAVSESL